MRATAVFLTTLLVALSGCFGDDGDDSSAPSPTPTEGGTPTPTDGVTPTPTATPTTTTPPATPTTTPTPGEDNETATPEPRKVATATHSFPTANAGDSEETLEPFEVPAGYGLLHLNVTFSPSASAGPLGAGVAREIVVKLRDPAGTDGAATCALDGAVPEPVACAVEVPVSAAGTWNIVFVGSGSVTAETSVVAV